MVFVSASLAAIDGADGGVTGYVLVAQDRPRIERFTRDGDDWVLTAFDGLEATVALASVGCGVRLGDVYAKVRWGADD